ncbi:MAG: hypothetical protein IPM46_14905 [Flavobacteriales bacterium]|nr:hypothetical protein [Flavobacteriales bacterium]
MIKFFRHIRQRMIKENRVSKYLLYAIGEIVLVVIGILIALQINNWNNYTKDRELEEQYVSGLIVDLQADSLSINKLKVDSDEQVRRKEKLCEYLDGGSFPEDSIHHYFSKQWGMSVGFNPTTTTFDEMKSAGRLNVIKDPALRSRIIKTYNKYQTFINGGQAYYERHRGELRKLAFQDPGVFDAGILKNPIHPNIVEALKNDELRNWILANYAVTVNVDLQGIQEVNDQLLEQLRTYHSEHQRQ